MMSLTFAAPFLAAAMTASPPPPADLEAQTNAWHEKRLKNLTSDDGWLTLVGLQWLEEGDQPLQLPAPAPHPPRRGPEGGPPGRPAALLRHQARRAAGHPDEGPGGGGAEEVPRHPALPGLGRLPGGGALGAPGGAEEDPGADRAG